MKTKTICQLQKRGIFKFTVISIFYSILAFLALRKLILQPGILGHNWDWFVPQLSNQLAHIAGASFYVWKEFSLGYSNALGLSSTLFYITSTSFGYLGFTGEFVSKFLPFITIILSGITTFYLVEDILKREFNNNSNNADTIFFSSLLAGYFYALSPFLFNEFISGAATQFFSYSLLPLTFYLFRKILQFAEPKRNIIFLAIVLSIISFSLQYIFLISIILLLYSLIQRNQIRSIEKLLQVYVLYFLLNIYWILPVLLSISDVSNVAFAEEAIFLPNIEHAVPSISQIFVGAGYFRPFFIMSIDPAIKDIWFISSFGMVNLIFASLFLTSKKSKETLFWSILLLLSFVFATGGKQPFGNLVLWIYSNIPLMTLFRSPQHLIVIPTLSLSILLGLGIYSFVTYLGTKNLEIIKKGYITFPVLFLLVSIWVSPFYSGNLGQDYLKPFGGGNYVDNYRLSPGYEKILNEINKLNGDFRILHLPMSASPYYLKTEYQGEGQGGDPTVIYSIRPTIVADMVPNPYAKQFISLLEKSFYDRIPPINASKLLGIVNVKYIILRKDVRAHFGPMARSWDYQQVYENLKVIEGIELVSEYNYTSLWENKYFASHIYATSNAIQLNGGFKEIVNVIENDDFVPGKSVLFLSEQLNQQEYPLINNVARVNPSVNPRIEFRKINPTKYVVYVNASEPFFLVFSESYHPQWKAYIGKVRWFEALYKKPISEEKHVLGNGYANTWYIDKTGEYEITLYFLPQNLFYVGLIISGMSLILFSIIVDVYRPK
jgi:hypothetical protein